MRTAVGAVAAAATALTLGAGTGAGAASAATSVGDAVVWPDTGTPVSLPMGTAIAGLPVTAESRDGYQRSSFKHWVDADRDGCSTRSEVLIDEGASPPSVGPRCALSGGIWLSYYDMKPVTDPRGLDIDHMVPLAEAWDSGASGWTSERRQDYAKQPLQGRSGPGELAAPGRGRALPVPDGLGDG
jgi:hypothetical protein